MASSPPKFFSMTMPVSPKGLASPNAIPLGCLDSVLKMYQFPLSLMIWQFSGVNHDEWVSHSPVSLRTCIHAHIRFSSPSGNLIALGASFNVAPALLPLIGKSPVRGVHPVGGGGGGAMSMKGSTGLTKLPSSRLGCQRPSIANATFVEFPSVIVTLSIFSPPVGLD